MANAITYKPTTLEVLSLLYAQAAGGDGASAEVYVFVASLYRPNVSLADIYDASPPEYKPILARTVLEAAVIFE